MPLKTLHLTNAWHETSGGIATFYRALIDEANRRKCEIRLVVPGKDDRIEEVGNFGRIYHVASRAALFNSKYRMIYPPQFLSAGSKLQNILALERPDVIEICDKYTLNYFGSLIRLGILQDINFRPAVVGLSCERMDDNFRSYLGTFPFAQKFCSWYMRWIYFSFFDHHIANSHYTADELRRAAQGHPIPRGTWIRPMGVDLSHLSPQRRSPAMRLRLLQNFGTDANSVLLLYVGRLVPEKNLALLFELMAHLSQNNKRDFRLLVVGDGMERARWEQESQLKMPGRVLFLGHMKDQNVLADLYANSDVFVHPNPHEPFGIAPLEAMASGLPLVAPNAGGVTSYANMENAWTVEPTVPDFAQAVEEVIADEKLRQAKVTHALEKSQEYRWNRIAASFLDLYSDIHNAVKYQRTLAHAPDFWSTPAKPTQKFLFQSVAQTAQKLFIFASRIGIKPGRVHGRKATDGVGC
jgi:glycosyltransferase involved in cell wall biosynthesis